MYEKIIKILKKIFSHGGIKIYSENLFFLSLEKIIRILVGFFVGIYIARALTPKYYGIFNYVISYVTIFSILSLSFLNNIAIREMAKDENNCGKILGSLRTLKFSGSLFMLLLIFISTYLVPMDNSVRILIWIFGLGAFFAGTDYFSPYFIFKRQNRIIALSSLVIFLIISALRVYCAWQKLPLIYFIILESVFLLGLFAVLGIVFYRKVTFKLENDQTEISRYIQTGKILFFTTLFSVISTKSELIILKELTGEDALGIYSVAMRIFETFSFITASFGLTFFPSIANSKNVSEELYNHRLKLYSGAIFYINLFCCIAIALASPILAMLYGKNYTDLAPLIAIYALRLPLFGMSAPLTQHLYIENKIKYLTLVTFVTMVLTIAFTIIMTRYYKLTGAAFSGLPIQILTIFILPLLCREKSLCTIFLHSLVYCPQELFKKLKNLISSTD